MSKAVPDYTHQGVDFYLSPKSRFPSGQATLESLQRNQLRELPLQEVTLQKNNLSLKQLPSDTLVNVEDLFFVLMNHGEVYFNVDRQGVYHKVRSAKNAKLFTWFSSDEMIPWEKDQGYALTLTKPYNKFRISELRNNQLVVRDNAGKERALPSTDVITKFDFVRTAECGTQTIQVKWREGLYFRGYDSQLFPITNCQKFTYDKDLFIVAKPNDLNLPVRTRTYPPTNARRIVWVESKLKRHGIVYWRKISKDDLKLQASSRVSE